ncbi:hypothetical protein [Hellea balneolensis]|uniref:hypothetical protein n=1 Tax=Hellea balneolensis TaxID=287478 RepID=UPI00047EBC48|nr:hypothetical protein [Hellea balneolensis]
MPMRVLKFWIAACVAAVFFLGCSQASDNEAKSSHLLGRYEAVTKKMAVTENSDVTLTTGHKMGWPGSGVAFRFEGKFAGISIEDSGNGIMDVLVNGEKSQLELQSGKHFYPIVKSQKRSVFDVRVTRRTEILRYGLFYNWFTVILV